MQLDLSIIIPCYNCENTIIRCLDSIPKGEGIEVILVDDCSSDNTLDTIKDYQKTYPKEKIQIVTNKENLGAGESRNRALGLLTRSYLTFVDADDQLSTDFSSQIVTELEIGFDCLIFDAERVSQSGTTVLRMFYTNEVFTERISQADALVYVRPATWGKIYRAQIIRDHCIHFGHIQRNEDLVFTKSALCFCENIRYLDKPLYLYNDNSSSLMNNRALLSEKNAMNAVGMVKPIIIGRGFSREYNSIFFLEIIYSTTMTLLRLGMPIRDCRAHFKRVNSLYEKKDPYRRKYLLHYRLSYLIFQLNMFFVFRLIFRNNNGKNKESVRTERKENVE